MPLSKPTVYVRFLVISALVSAFSTGTGHAQTVLDLIGQWTDEPSGAVAVRDTLVFSGSDTSLVVLSVADPAHPEKLADVHLPLTPRDILVRGDFVFAAGGFPWEAGSVKKIFTMIDISSPNDPVVTGTGRHEYFEDAYHVKLRGDTAFVPAWGGTTSSWMFDISDPYDIRKLDSFAGSIFDVEFSEGALYGIGNHRPYYYRVSTWKPLVLEDPSFQWFERGPAPSRSGLILDSLLYVVGDSGLYIFDVYPDSLLPTLVGSLEALGDVRELALANGMVYVAGREDGLFVVDAGDPTRPELVADYDQVHAMDVAVSDSLVVIAAADEGLYVLKDQSTNGTTNIAREPGPSPGGRSALLDPVTPHPISSVARFSYSVPTAGHARLVIYDLLGRAMTVLVDDVVPYGEHTLTWHPDELANGTYVLVLQVSGRQESRLFSVMR